MDDKYFQQLKAELHRAIRPATSKRPRRCHVCGCTDADRRQCIERTGKPCRWVGPDICSACVPGSDGDGW